MDDDDKVTTESCWGPSSLRAVFPIWRLGQLLFQYQQEYFRRMLGREEPKEEADEPIIVDA